MFELTHSFFFKGTLATEAYMYYNNALTHVG